MRQVPAASANNFEHLESPAITPFWQRLPLFFRYPFHAEPLLYMVALSLATLLGFVLPIPMPFDHLLVHFGVWLAFINVPGWGEVFPQQLAGVLAAVVGMVAGSLVPQWLRHAPGQHHAVVGVEQA